MLHVIKQRALVRRVRRRQAPVDAVRRYRKSGEIVPLPIPRIALFDCQSRRLVAPQ